MGTIVFVGAGSMAEAIIAGIVGKNVMAAENVHVMNKSDDGRLAQLHEMFGVSLVCAERKALGQADLIVLATKPKDIWQAMRDIEPFIGKDTAVLSVIAGVSIDTIESGLGKRPVARSMPNTSAAIGKSATGITLNDAIDGQMQTLIIELLSAIGLVKIVEEDNLHAVTALSGSGPAYVYYMVEALEEAAIAQGLPKEVARDLVIQTFEGAALMLKLTGEEPDLLRKNVTSPGGTTEAGIQALEGNFFKEAIAACVHRAVNRSRELGAQSHSAALPVRQMDK